MELVMTEIPFIFESNDRGGYIDVLANSGLVPGAIVSQNAGSTNPGMYYQVGVAASTVHLQGRLEPKLLVSTMSFRQPTMRSSASAAGLGIRVTLHRLYPSHL